MRKRRNHHAGFKARVALEAVNASALNRTGFAGR
ncbi:hypothetical protein SAMN05519105_4081 [Rhodobacter sp. 24-YEA-8]|nr:hypothetical protein SAMN05519105_4081 [Rhodobacter sp. 24-YEA-8]